MKELPNPTMPLSFIDVPRGSLHRNDQDAQKVSVSAQKTETRPALIVEWAKHQDEVREAQRLRYDVFATEMGARLKDSIPGHDIDLFDDFCEHLIIRDDVTEQVIGTYRVLTPASAKRIGGLYSETEFDLTRLRPLRAKMVAAYVIGAEWKSHRDLLLYACEDAVGVFE